MPTFTATDGVEIAYRVWECDSDLPLVLLHHGFIADGRTNWEVTGVVAALTAAGRRVAAIDARGHGASGKPHDPARYGEARMAEDVGTLVDLLGEPRYDLAGYSMGAVVSLLAAARDRRVRRLAVGGVGAAVVELGGVDTRVIRAEALRSALLTDDPASITDQGAADFRAFVDAIGGDRTALAAQAASVHDRPIALGAIEAPTLVLAGVDDPLAARPEVLARAIPGATLRTVPGDHLGAVADPAFAKELVAFLNAGPDA
ncbi:alpha/beta fold hydrolase [Actinomadura fibrosa]|uniref:Alpha/beta fold hydrolase n=1 Tax=Actinomadura fibrosa TaxID=111802 RepID=A0ABW2XWB4_9ACTN|nr:alpha/beta fold hydrolase [Actinomadura fibrosa]